MAISERQRRQVFDKFEEAFGTETADVVMQMFPRVSNDEIATRSDLTAMGTLLRGELAELRAELKGEMAELRAELKGEMAELRADVRTEIAGLQRWMAGIMAANAVAVVTALLA